MPQRTFTTTLSRPDHALMRKVNNWEAPRWVQNWMVTATKFGDGYVWIFVSIALLLTGSPVRYRAVLAGMTAAFLTVVLFQQIKKLVGRKRPCHVQPHCWAQLLPPDQFSFPSGHTMTAFAFTYALEPFFPITFLPLLFIAINIAASRVLVGMHFLSDVLVGALLGFWIGRYVAFLFL